MQVCDDRTYLNSYALTFCWGQRCRATCRVIGWLNFGPRGRCDAIAAFFRFTLPGEQSLPLGQPWVLDEVSHLWGVRLSRLAPAC